MKELLELSRAIGEIAWYILGVVLRWLWEAVKWAALELDQLLWRRKDLLLAVVVGLVAVASILWTANKTEEARAERGLPPLYHDWTPTPALELMAFPSMDMVCVSRGDVIIMCSGEGNGDLSP